MKSLLTSALVLSLALTQSVVSPPVAQAEAGEVGDTIEDFTLVNLKDGKEVKFSSYKGKVVLMSFWASWCGPCRRELPAYNELYKTYKDQGLEVVAISVDRTKEEADGFLAKIDKLDYTLLLDDKSKIMGRYDIVSMPTSFIIGKDGKVILRETGFSDEKLAEVKTALEKALK